MSKYDEALEIVCHASRMKMTLNSHKGAIEGIPPEVAIKLLKKELTELEDALKDNNHEEVIIEAGDVLNFLTSLVYNSIDGYRKRK